MNDFKLIKGLGLEVIEASKLYEDRFGKAPQVYHVNAHDLEALFERGRRFSFREYDTLELSIPKEDTADSLLRELIYRGDIAIPHGLFERAQKVLNAAAPKKS